MFDLLESKTTFREKLKLEIMKYSTLSLLLFCVFFSCQMDTSDSTVVAAKVDSKTKIANQKKDKNKAEKTELAKTETLDLFDKHCSSCHGSSIEAFVQEDWKYGHSWNEVNASITNKHSQLSKAASLQSLSADQISKITDHILYAIESTTIESFDTEADWTGTITSEAQNFKLETIASEVGIPWGFDFFPNGDLLITDRAGTMYYQKAGGDKTKIKGLPKIKVVGQGGLLDVAIHPDFNSNQTIFFAYTKPKGISETTTSMVKATLANNEVKDLTEIMEALPYHGTRNHYGSRLQFDDKGYLYVTVGDRFRRDENPQDLSRHAGKIHRFHADGSIPKDNPFVHQKGVIASIWSYGHRNPQGLAYDAATGKLWESEHAPRGGDEINLIQPSLNYGWPVVSYGINYNGSVFTNLTHQADMEQPAHYYVPSPALSGLAVVNSDQYPNWKGNLMAGSLRFQYLSRLTVKDDSIIAEERLLENIGRVRSVELDPNGYICIGVETGHVYRLLPM